MKYKLFSHISAIVLPMLFVVLACLSCDNKESVMRIDHYNDVSYQNHYRSLETTKRYAQRALILAENIGYDDGKAEALNNLAFVSIAKMDYDKAYDLLNQVASTTDNTIELLVAKVQLMRLCQRQSENKNFYHHNQRALLYMRRIEEDKQLLDDRQKARMVYARTEYDIVLSSYLYYVGQYEKSAECLNSIDPNGEIVKDTAQMLSYLYNVGAGGILQAQSKAQLEQEEFDYLIRCYVLSRQYRFYFWEANSLQAISEHIQNPASRRLLIKANYQEFEYINVDDMPDSLLAGNLAQRALVLFARYGDTYQAAGAWRTLSEAYSSIGDYPSSLICLNNALSQDTAINAAPDLVASIREQLSIVYSAIDDKRQSDYNRNIYLDIQERTRQDRMLEARAEQLDSSLKELDIMIGTAIIAILLLVSLLVYIVLKRRKNRPSFPLEEIEELKEEWIKKKEEVTESLRDRIVETEEETGAAECQLDNYRRRNLEQRAKVFFASSVMPLINRMKREVEKMSSKVEAPSEAKEATEYVQLCLNTIELYNERLTDWIKLSKGDFMMHIESFCMEELFAVLAKSTMEYRMRGVTLDIRPTDAVVKADRTMTLFMINTITDNARKFTPSGGRIVLEACVLDDSVEVSVTDNGKGMTKEQTQQIFNHNVIQESKSGGHGFGLINCKGIIEKYRKLSSLFNVCTIGVESEPGKGSRFFFRLPKGIRRTLAILIILVAGLQGAMAEQQHNAAEKATTQQSYYARKAAAFADSAYYSNIRGNYHKTLIFADSCLSCINEQRLLLMADDEGAGKKAKMMKLFGDYPSVAAELEWLQNGVKVDYNIILDVRNETAVAALALHKWSLYSYNNSIYTQMFRFLSADATLPSYVSAMQESESNRNVAMAVLIIVLLMIFPVYYLLYYRHRLSYHFWTDKIGQTEELLKMTDMDVSLFIKKMEALWRNDNNKLRIDKVPDEISGIVNEIILTAKKYEKAKEDLNEEEEIKKDNLRRAVTDRDRLYVANNVLDNCLSSLKHETMYYPSRLKQMLDRGGEVRFTAELVEYYELIYSSLLKQAVSTLGDVGGFLRTADLMRYLTTLLKRKNGGSKPSVEINHTENGYVVISLAMNALKLTPEQAKNLFSPLTTDVDFLVCCQIMRDIGEITGARACGISAFVDNEDKTIIKIKTTKETWKNSQLS